MGCALSRIENDEAVSRCKERRNLMKDAVCRRNAFSSAHIEYGVALKHTGAALSDYGHGETAVTDMSRAHGGGPISDDSSAAAAEAAAAASMDPGSFPPPPPPPPNFSPSPLQRAVTMPELHAGPDRKNLGPIPMVIHEDDARETPVVSKKLRGVIKRGSVTPDGGHLPPPSPSKTPPITPAPPPPPPDLKGMAWDYFFHVDNIPGQSLTEEDDEIEYDEDGETDEKPDRGAGGENDELDGPKPGNEEKALEKQTQIKRANSDGSYPEIMARNRMNPHVNLLQILDAIDDQFLKASERSQEVSKLLETNVLHSNYSDDNRGHIDHSARVMRVITWNRSFRNNSSNSNLEDDYNSEEHETHATILDKLLTWERKLYDEVKAAELMKIEYERKARLLNKQQKKKKKNGTSSESLEKTKAAVRHLYMKYTVDMQSLDCTVSEVNRLRDHQLYPKLIALADGMGKMWEAMRVHHEKQLNISMDLKMLDVTPSPMATSKHHHAQTQQLLKVIEEWHSGFDDLVTHQKQYVRSLNSWLKLNLIPIEGSSSSNRAKEKASPSVQQRKSPAIQILLHTWQDLIEKLPDEVAKNAMSSFAAVMKTILMHQEAEMRARAKCEETKRELGRRSEAFNDWHHKYNRSGKASVDDGDPDPVSERRFAVDTLRKRLDDEVRDHLRHCVQIREKSLGTLKTRLPDIFRAVSDYSRACAHAYAILASIHPKGI